MGKPERVIKVPFMGGYIAIYYMETIFDDDSKYFVNKYIGKPMVSDANSILASQYTLKRLGFTYDNNRNYTKEYRVDFRLGGDL